MELEKIEVSEDFKQLYGLIWQHYVKQKYVYLYRCILAKDQIELFLEMINDFELVFQPVDIIEKTGHGLGKEYHIVAFSTLPFEYSWNKLLQRKVAFLKNRMCIRWDKNPDKVYPLLQTIFSLQDIREIKKYHGDKGKALRLEFVCNIGGIIEYYWNDKTKAKTGQYFYNKETKTVENSLKFSEIEMFGKAADSKALRGEIDKIFGSLMKKSSK